MKHFPFIFLLIFCLSGCETSNYGYVQSSQDKIQQEINHAKTCAPEYQYFRTLEYAVKFRTNPQISPDYIFVNYYKQFEACRERNTAIFSDWERQNKGYKLYKFYKDTLRIALGSKTNLNHDVPTIIQTKYDELVIENERIRKEKLAKRIEQEDAAKAKLPNNKKTIANYTGTGWVVQGGYIVTNYHVIEGQIEIKVRFNNIGFETVDAQIILFDRYNDLAILEIDNILQFKIKGIPISRKLPKLGESVFTIGYPKTDVMGKNAKVTSGIISALSGIYDDPRLIQTTVALQAGNSGGPLLNMKGEAIGVTTATLRSQSTKEGIDVAQNVNYAVKSAYVLALLASLPVPETYPKINTTEDKLENVIPIVKDSIVQIFVKSIK